MAWNSGIMGFRSYLVKKIEKVTGRERVVPYT